MLITNTVLALLIQLRFITIADQTFRIEQVNTTNYLGSPALSLVKNLSKL